MKIKNIIPLDDRLLVRPDIELKSGLILIPDTHRKERQSGTILTVSVAPAMQKTFTPGQRILYSEEAGFVIPKYDLEDSDRDLLLLPLPDVLGILT